MSFNHYTFKCVMFLSESTLLFIDYFVYCYGAWLSCLCIFKETRQIGTSLEQCVPFNELNLRLGVGAIDAK